MRTYQHIMRRVNVTEGVQWETPIEIATPIYIDNRRNVENEMYQ